VRAPRPPIVAPSILSADFARLAEQVAIVDPARDWVHCDVMDHHFVPNLTFGPLVVEAVARATTAVIDVHLMTERPAALAPAFRKAGAHRITLHLEACRAEGEPLAAFDPSRVDPGRVTAALDAVRATGAQVGLALKPATPLESAAPFLDAIDLLLVMTVEPGFGGQSFREEQLEKVRAAAEWKRRHGASWLVEVDGGIAPDTARRCREAGAEVFVAGHAVFRQPDPRSALEGLRGVVG
jgi:ribulose-phosphate 3-epimerase